MFVRSYFHPFFNFWPKSIKKCSFIQVRSSHQLCFQNNFVIDFVLKIGKFVKLILFAGLVLPSWLRHILYKVFDSLPPVIEVMIFIPTWPTIRWRMFNIPKRILGSTYMLIASAWKINCFWIWKQRKYRK